MEKKFTKSHEWIETDGKTGVVGITDYAQHELGEIVYAELPEVGQNINAGEEIVVLESTKAAADVYAPVSGTVTEVNGDLEEDPSWINQDAEGKGWLYKIELEDVGELQDLLDAKDYEGILR